MRVSLVECPVCRDIIYSRTEFDLRLCTCKTISVTGDPLTPKVTVYSTKSARPRKVEADIPRTEAELFLDYNDELDLLGKLRKPSSDKKSQKLLIEHTKMVLDHNKERGNTVLVELFSNQLTLLEEENVGLQFKS